MNPRTPGPFIAVSEQNASGKEHYSAAQRVLPGKLIGACILSSAICIGLYLDIGRHAVSVPSVLVSRPNPIIQPIDSGCGGIRAAAGSATPPGYTPVAIRRIEGDCFELLRGDAADASPSLGLSGEADEFGPDGRLNVRFFAIGEPNGRWQVFEYRRLPAGDPSRMKTEP